LNADKGGMTIALADVDGDGDLDLYIANYRTWTYRDRPAIRIRVRNRDGQFVVTHVDDRPVTEPDLVGRFTVRPGGGAFEEHGEEDLLCLNDGRGGFAPVSWTDGSFQTEDGGPLRTRPFDWGLTAMFRDVNGDGAPDLYVCNDFQSPDRLWLNDGHGRFRLAPLPTLRQTCEFSMSVDFADVDRDGHDDFFLTDMLSPVHAKRHVQVGNLRPKLLPPGPGDERLQYSRNMLLRNRGDGTYEDIGCYAGVIASEWSWGQAFLDVDLDGYEDLLIATGNELDSMNNDVIEEAERLKAAQPLSPVEQMRLRRMFARLDTPNVAFRNRGDLTFEDASAAWGFDTRSVSQGLALADLDNDGDLDVVVNNLNGPAGLYRNNATAPRVMIRLKGRPPNTHGIGAKIRLFGGAVPMQSQEVIAGGRYLSSDQPARVFAAGSLTNTMRVEITWRSGRRSVLDGVRANRIYEIDEDCSALAAAPVAAGRATASLAAPLFEDVSQLLQHVHYEAPFDDFERQPLLPRRLSQLGPGVAWHDVNGDGRDDAIVASGRGGTLAVFTNRGDGTFERLTDAPLDRPVARDQTTVLGIGPILFVGSANYEDGSTNGGWIRIYDLARKASGESVLGPEASTGPLAMADVDGDGDLDLFIGGRSVAGRYAEPATSLLVRNDNGRFVPAQRWENLGLVSGAVFTDFDGDGDPDLALACEWGPVRLFRNQQGRFEAWDAPLVWAAAAAADARQHGATGPTEGTAASGPVPLRLLSGGSTPGHAPAGPLPSRFSQLTGWWTGLTAGDLDGDGRLDLIVANWGLNHKYPASLAEPRRLYYGDLDGDGTVDVVEAYCHAAMGKTVPERGFDLVSKAVPSIRERIGSYTAYGLAGVEAIFGEGLQRARMLEVNTLASMVFFNRTDHWEPVPLPAEAQFAPALGVCVADADGDGYEDVFLSQNFFAVNAEGWRHDAGRGLWLRGDGRGGLEAVPGQQSGVRVYGEQRGCAVGDYDGDGRVDLLVAQNSAATRLFHNTGGRPGLRVRLLGPPNNPAAFGAQLRLRNARGQGPVREIHGGSGYWSLDSAVSVLTLAEAPTHVWVRWPDGTETLTEIPPGALEITLRGDGRAQVVRAK
jgi:hypothetical protein